ncbi:MAG: DOMON-like domain-containing protein [Pseudomonadota bacterium]
MPDFRAELYPHPASPSGPASKVWVTGERASSGLALAYSVNGNFDALAIPDGPGGRRMDGLWKHTCFELFMRPANSERYYEFNFAPNANWAAYKFESYREGGADLEKISAQIDVDRRDGQLTLVASLTGLSAVLLDAPISIGLSAVIEAETEALSYWALYHPLSKPDFHHSESFKLNLD